MYVGTISLITRLDKGFRNNLHFPLSDKNCCNERCCYLICYCSSNLTGSGLVSSFVTQQIKYENKRYIFTN
jgi:hypothetical protein